MNHQKCFRVFELVHNNFQPDVIVTQCGADACARDPNGGANLTARSYCRCVRRVLDKRKPTLLLGGGGLQFLSDRVIELAVWVRLDSAIQYQCLVLVFVCLCNFMKSSWFVKTIGWFKLNVCEVRFSLHSTPPLTARCDMVFLLVACSKSPLSLILPVPT